jgi:hypothetical protein
MYCGEYTLKALDHFMAGYRFAIDVHEIRDPNDPFSLWPDFYCWVAYRLRFKEPTSGWCNMIQSRTSSEKEAIERFFSLLDEYHHRTPHLVAKLDAYHASYARIRDGEVESVEYPSSISLVTYTDDRGFFALSDDGREFPPPTFFPNIDWFETFTGAKRELLTIVDPTWNYGIRDDDSQDDDSDDEPGGH